MSTTTRQAITRDVQVITPHTIGAQPSVQPAPFVMGLDLHIIGIDGVAHLAPELVQTAMHRIEIWEHNTMRIEEIPYALTDDAQVVFKVADTIVQISLREVITEILTGFSHVAYQQARDEFTTTNAQFSNQP